MARTVKISHIKEARERTRRDLNKVRAMLDRVRTSAMHAELRGLSPWVFQMQSGVLWILSWVGTPIADTNTSSKTMLYPRITNSSSREQEIRPVSAKQSAKNRDGSTNTQFEEQPL